MEKTSTSVDEFNDLIDKFVVGSVVALNSGGALMTVSAAVKRAQPASFSMIGHAPHCGVHCAWLTEDGEIQSHVFMPQMLRIRKE